MKNGGFDPKNCRLHKHNSQIWNGFIYVNLNSGITSFEYPVLNGLLKNYETEKFKLAHVSEEVWNTNWKCLVENFME